MTFNKWFPNRIEPPPTHATPLQRARLMQWAIYASTAMLVLGYIILAVIVAQGE